MRPNIENPEFVSVPLVTAVRFSAPDNLFLAVPRPAIYLEAGLDYPLPLWNTRLMELQYTYWQDGDYYVGFINDYPEDSTQGLTLSELEESLAEVYEIRQEEGR
jgi:hypothetical protein